MRRLIGAAIVVLVMIVAALFYSRNEAKRPARTGTTAPASNTSHADISHARQRARPLYLSDVSVGGDAQAASGSIAGRVLSTRDGSAVPAAQLSFFRGASFDVSADAEGRFRFAPPAPGTYELTSVSARGFHAFAGEPGHGAIRFEARAGQKLDGVTVYLEPARTLSVLVKEPSGRPAAGAEVRAFDAMHGRDAAASAVTDDKGEAQLSSGDMDLVEAHKAGFARARARVDFVAQSTGRIVLTLGRGADVPLASISGRVVGSDGQPIDGALVEAFPPRDVDSVGARTLSDATGRFVLRELEAQSYTLRARAAGRGTVERAGVPSGSDGIELRLAARAGIRGLVSDGKGKPVAAFTIVAWPRIGSIARGEEVSATIFNAEGRYELELTPGDWIVRAAAHGFAPAKEQSITVGDGFATLDFALGRGGRVFGRVTDRASGTGIGGARVLLEGFGGDGITLSSDTTSDASGSFSISGIAPGKQSIDVLATGHNGRIVSGIDVPADGDVGPLTIDLRPLAPGEEPKLEMQGIGAVLGSDESGLVVKSVLPTGGAAAAGLVAGDVIVAVDDTPVDQLGFPGAIQALRGPEGSSVSVTVRHVDGSTAVVSIPRRRLNG